VNMVANQTTALFQASQKGHTDVVKVLTEANANVDLGDIDDTSTPLFMAVQNGHTDVVKMLVRAHADVNQARATDGSTPLFMAAQDGYIDIVEVLLAAHADVNKARTTDAQRGNAGAAPGSPRLVEEGATPLHVAAQNSHVDVIKMLLAAGADRNKASEKGWTPFKAAKRWGSKEAQDALRPPEAEH
jgi:ankyrin repeat protein